MRVGRGAVQPKYSAAQRAMRLNSAPPNTHQDPLVRCSTAVKVCRAPPKPPLLINTT